MLEWSSQRWVHKHVWTENKLSVYLNLVVKYFHIFLLFINRGYDCMNLKQLIWADSGDVRDVSLKIVSYESTKINFLIDEL